MPQLKPEEMDALRCMPKFETYPRMPGASCFVIGHKAADRILELEVAIRQHCTGLDSMPMQKIAREMYPDGAG